MRIHWYYTGCDREDEREIERCWDRVRPGVEAKLQSDREQPAELGLSVIHRDGRPEWHVQAALHLPTRTLVAESDANEVGSALENVVAGLAGQVETVESRSTIVERRRQGLHAIVPILAQCRSVGRGDAFFSFLRPLMGTLRTHIRRELDVLETEEILSGGDVALADVTDETMMRAWDAFDDRPSGMPLDLWLLQLVDRVIADLSGGRFVRESLEERRPFFVPTLDSGQEGARDESWEHENYPESIELAELIPGEPGLEVWDRLDREARRRNLAHLFGDLSRAERHALVLYAVEGYDLADIAQMQGRSTDEVQADIETARRRLAQRLREDEALVDRTEEFELRGGRDTARRRR